MDDGTRVVRRKRGRGVRPWLIQLKTIGLVGFLGGFAALTALGWLGPVPEDEAGWRLLRGVVRAIFWPCVFCGLLVTVGAGIALWLQHPRVFATRRWFRLKAGLLLVLLPTLHLWARSRVGAFYAAIDGGAPDIAEHWRRVSVAFAVALVVMLAVATLGRVKPRLGQPVAPAPPTGGR